MDLSFIKDLTVTRGDNSETVIEGEIPFAVLETQRKAALEHLGKDIELDGFRKGHVPENVLMKHVGEMALLSEMAERALAKSYPEMLKQHNIDPIGYPQVSITKLAADNPLGVKLTVAVVPDITLPNYKSIAAELNKNKASTDVTDVDVEKQIEDIMRQKLAYERLQQKAAAKAASEETVKDLDGATELPTPESEAAKAEVDAPLETEEDLKKLPLPELTDEYVKTLGQPGQFESVDDFKAKLREHLAIEKEREVTTAHRAKLTDSIIEASTLTLPQVLIDTEVQQMWAQMEEDIKRNDLKMEDYLAHIKKTEEELKAEWVPAAEKRAKLQLILNEIAKQENITPDEKIVSEQVAALKQQYQDADEARVRVYVESILQNEAVMKLLEEQK